MIPALVGIFICVVINVTLFILTAFEDKKDELLECVIYTKGSVLTAVTDILNQPEDRLKEMEEKISKKAERFILTKQKMIETKRTISELEVASKDLESSYKCKLSQMKCDLSKSEMLCLNLYRQIENIIEDRNQLRADLEQRQVTLSRNLFPKNHIGKSISDAPGDTTKSHHGQSFRNIDSMNFFHEIPISTEDY